MYGNTVSYRNRILKKYDSRSGSNTGILASGNKGSGKSLLAKDIGSAIIDRENGVVINVAIKATGSEFAQILQNVNQPCMVLFDEFEKIYDRDLQEKMLSVMDGGLTKDILFVITANNVYKLDEHMINRPGRIFYHIKYEGLDRQFIEEYCNDRLDNMDHLVNILQTSSIIDDMNFDMLQAIVSELNTFPDMTYVAAMEIMNITATKFGSSGSKFKLEVIQINDTSVIGLYGSDTCKNPLTENVYSYLYKKSADEDDCGDEDEEEISSDGMPSYIQFTNDSFKIEKITNDGNVFYFRSTDGTKIVTATRIVEKNANPLYLTGTAI